jgi:hypothetical protein
VLGFFWAKNLQKAISFFRKKIFCHKYFIFLKTINHKLVFQERIATIIIIIDENFEETSKTDPKTI